MNTTLLRDALVLLHTVDRHRDRVLYTLRNLPNAVPGQQPVFVFAHLLSPHRPFIFRAPGLPASVGGYGGQVLYLSTLLEEAVRRILARAPRPPVIIIQADHGLRESLDWRDSPRSRLQERHSILYAAYLPSSSAHPEPPLSLYDSVSPVNTFRVVFSQYFDTTMVLLPDRSYYSLPNRPYHFYDVDQPESYPIIGRTAEPVATP